MSASDGKLAIIGWPVSHSRSPLIHNHWLAARGEAPLYQPYPIDPKDDFRGALATAKARAVFDDEQNEGLIIGADQILECDGVLYDKPRNMDEARRNLLRFRGKSHYLVGAVVLLENGQQVWSHCGRVALTMRDFSEPFLDAYLAQAGEAVLSSVGCYQLEGLGAHLFADIDGDYFSILGLPLLPLLDGLRAHGGLSA